MAPKTQDAQADPIGQADFQAALRDRLRDAVRSTLVAVMEEEQVFARYARRQTEVDQGISEMFVGGGQHAWSR